MKIFSFLFLLIFLFSCASQQGSRGLASEKRIELYQVGEIKTSLLESDEFQDKYGEAWVLMDGRDVGGSEFASLTAMTSVPDARGKFLRMSNNGASGEKFDPENERALGSYQGDLLKSHDHSLTASHAYIGGFNSLSGIGSGSAQGRSRGPIGHEGGAETRPKNILVNYYIKIRSCSSGDDVCL